MSADEIKPIIDKGTFDIGFEDGIVPVLAQPERPVPNGTILLEAAI